MVFLWFWFKSGYIGEERDAGVVISEDASGGGIQFDSPLAGHARPHQPHAKAADTGKKFTVGQHRRNEIWFCTLHSYTARASTCWRTNAPRTLVCV